MRRPRWRAQAAIQRVLQERGDWTTLAELTAFEHHPERFRCEADQAYH